jgi:hypothetical protein
LPATPTAKSSTPRHKLHPSSRRPGEAMWCNAGQPT